MQAARKDETAGARPAIRDEEQESGNPSQPLKV